MKLENSSNPKIGKDLIRNFDNLLNSRHNQKITNQKLWYLDNYKFQMDLNFCISYIEIFGLLFHMKRNKRTMGPIPSTEDRICRYKCPLLYLYQGMTMVVHSWNLFFKKKIANDWWKIKFSKCLKKGVAYKEILAKKAKKNIPWNSPFLGNFALKIIFLGHFPNENYFFQT